VIDARGRRVTTLHSGPLMEGVHRFRWDGTDAEGRAVASGTYTVRARTDGSVVRTRVTLAR
jgi:flagellar basal-body rod modification protein FlgD